MTAWRCLDAHLIDEVLVHVAPVQFGDRVRLLDFPGGTKTPLERLSLTHSDKVTNLWMRVVTAGEQV